MTKEQKYRDVIKVLRSLGWQKLRVKGSHEIWQGPGGERFVVPRHRSVSSGVMQKLIKILPPEAHDWR
ncbi:type II toxin-antitoxin system HicA family toxin [Rothia nasimurium]|uniref:type II toxin-antitoxin system HicA family toxin n=1 Tax=Rothia nasimurium TaxID=85336 RepID=UPI001F027F6E|nr:type II toxin-antitoxin system HicA family toxin [Rothia nasimurium]